MNQNLSSSARLIHKLYPYFGLSFAFFNIIDILFYNLFKDLPGLDVLYIHEFILLFMNCLGIVFCVGFWMDHIIKNTAHWKTLLIILILVYFLRFVFSVEHFFTLGLSSVWVFSLLDLGGYILLFYTFLSIQRNYPENYFDFQIYSRMSAGLLVILTVLSRVEVLQNYHFLIYILNSLLFYVWFSLLNVNILFSRRNSNI